MSTCRTHSESTQETTYSLRLAKKVEKGRGGGVDSEGTKRWVRGWEDHKVENVISAATKRRQCLLLGGGCLAACSRGWVQHCRMTLLLNVFCLCSRKIQRCSVYTGKRREENSVDCIGKQFLQILWCGFMHTLICKTEHSMNLLQKVKNGIGYPYWCLTMLDIHLWRLLWTDCPGHAGVKKNDQTDRLAVKATTTRGLCLGRSEPIDTKPRTWHHRLPGGERRRKMKCLTIFLVKHTDDSSVGFYRWHVSLPYENNSMNLP